MAARFRFDQRNALGTFGKGTPCSVSLNFGRSGGKYCDTGCSHHPDNNGDCYAIRVELRYPAMAAKLDRHESQPPAMIVNRGLLDLQELHGKGKTVDWLRISTNGSLPQPEQVRDDNMFRDAVRALVSYCISTGVPVHLPVETAENAEFYRELLGDLAVTVRQSTHSLDEFLSTDGAVSCTAGDNSQPLMERVATARDVAAQRRAATGRKAIVCPAVPAGFRLKLNRDKAAKPGLQARANKAKCGSCTACSMPHVDVVYPLH